MRIVFLDAGTVDYGDLSLNPLRRLGQLRIYHHTPVPQIFSRCRQADIVITNKCIFDARLILQLPRLKAIAVTATGYNNIDAETARKRGIAVMNVSNYSTESVAQMTLGFILSLAGKIEPAQKACHQGAWSRSPFFVMGQMAPLDLKGKVLGIVGYGHIGKRVARLAKAFGMRVRVGMIPGKTYTAEERKQRMPLAALAGQADFLSLHAPLSPMTRELINQTFLKRMKPSAYLINAARGGLVNEKDLRFALEKRWIAGAATDVLSREPPPRNHVLIGAPRLLMTPHVAWASLASRKKLIREVALNLQAFQRGKRRNRIV